MTINKKVNRCLSQIMHIWKSNTHRERSKWKCMCTWATSHNALSRNGISTQLTNTNYSSCISKCKTRLKQNTLSTTIDNQKGSNTGPAPKPNLLFMSYSHKSHVLELWRNHYCLCRIKEIRRLFKNRNGIKTIGVKTWF